MLRYAPLLTLGLFLGPVVAGLLGTLLPAFGYLPTLGSDRFSVQPWVDLMATPGIERAIGTTILTGIASTLVALVLTILLFAAGQGTRAFIRAKRAMTPLLAVPHLAMAIGLAFLMSPSGWIARLISPWPSGWTNPPDIAFVQGPYGIALIIGLVIKELPFLVLMTFSASGQLGTDRHLRVARSLGYGPVQAWLKVVLPLVYPQIRLPIYAILAFSLSVVDMAMVLGPTTPPSLAILVFRWFHDPELTLRFQAAAGAILQLLLVITAIATWRLGEIACWHASKRWRIGGGRGGSGRWPGSLAWIGLGLAYLLALGGIAGLLVWSIAGRWRFPMSWPKSVSFELWMRELQGLAEPALTTLITGLIAMLIALVLVISCLEHESRRHRQAGRGALLLVYLPLVIPQISFLFGVQVLLIRSHLDGSWIGLIWAHLLFVLPYMFLTLSDPYRALDPRYARLAATLGKSPTRIWLQLKLALLLRPLMIAAAVGFAVSVAQFLPTQFVAAGRLSTLTTEALSLASGGNRRIAGMFAFTLAILPLLGFALAQAIPALRFRHRSAMRIETSHE